MQFFIIIALAIALLAVTFALQNPGIIIIKFLAWEFNGSLALILLATFALGFISSTLISSAKNLRKRLKEKSESPQPPEPPISS